MGTLLLIGYIGYLLYKIQKLENPRTKYTKIPPSLKRFKDR